MLIPEQFLRQAPLKLLQLSEPLVTSDSSQSDEDLNCEPTCLELRIHNLSCNSLSSMDRQYGATFMYSAGAGDLIITGYYLS